MPLAAPVIAATLSLNACMIPTPLAQAWPAGGFYASISVRRLGCLGEHEPSDQVGHDDAAALRLIMEKCLKFSLQA
jgi:hypothetical protein